MTKRELEMTVSGSRISVPCRCSCMEWIRINADIQACNQAVVYMPENQADKVVFPGFGRFAKHMVGTALQARYPAKLSVAGPLAQPMAPAQSLQVLQQRTHEFVNEMVVVNTCICVYV